jgi:tetratricopeptide (TPR) repeat protein
VFFKKKCPICGAKNSRDATTCASCGTPFELRQAEGQIAIDDYDEAIRINPKDAVAYFNRGTTYHSLNKKKRAIEDYDQAIRLNPEYADAYHNRGTTYRVLGQFRRAIEDYDQAIHLNPRDAVAYNNRGNAYKLQGKKAEAIADFEKLITLTDNPQWVKIARQQIEELQSQ